MRYRVELSTEAQKQLAKLPNDVRERVVDEIDEMEDRDDSRWSNIKAPSGIGMEGILSKAIWLLSNHLHEVSCPWCGGNFCHPD